MTYETNTKYFSGQGQVLLALRDASGKPKGFRAIGNVSSLKITVGTSVIEHKESMSGARGIDKRLTTELKVGLSLTVENFSSKNLADAMRASASSRAAGTVVGETLKGYPGTVTPLANLKVSALAVKVGATALSAYVDGLTPWDYIPNLAAGSFQLNNGSVLALDKLGVAITAVTVGLTTVFTVANDVTVGSEFTPRGLTGADAAFLNNKALIVASATGTTVTVAVDTTAKVITITGTPKAVWEGMAITADYTYAAQESVEALTDATKEVWMRFEGLNTAEDNAPVVVDVFKFSTDPLKELDLIADTLQKFVLDGSVLADSQRPTGSNYFTVRKLA